MVIIGKWQQSFTSIILVTLGAIIARPGWCDLPPAANQMLSESLCLKVFEETLEKGRSNNWRISEQDRQTLARCRIKFAPSPNQNAPLPTPSQCLYFLKTVAQGGLSHYWGFISRDLIIGKIIGKLLIDGQNSGAGG